MSQVWVVKLGGSLTNSPLLKDWLDLLVAHGQGRVVIVPGGGCFADQVRVVQNQWDFDDQYAHQMALLAMQQMAVFFQGMVSKIRLACSPEQVTDLLENQEVVAWFPDITELTKAGIDASWDVTSDSLAAWIAQQLSATKLILVKSALIPEWQSTEELIELGIVDKAFNQYACKLNSQIEVINRRDIESFRSLFAK